MQLILLSKWKMKAKTWNEIELNCKLTIIISLSIINSDLLCSVSSPNNFILLASCCAFFLRRHARDANLFFSLRNLGRSLNGDSLTDVIWLIVRPNLSNSLPMHCNLRGFGVKSLPSPLRALPLCCNFVMWTDYFMFLSYFCIISSGVSLP